MRNSRSYILKVISCLKILALLHLLLFIKSEVVVAQVGTFCADPANENQVCSGIDGCQGLCKNFWCQTCETKVCAKGCGTFHSLSAGGNANCNYDPKPAGTECEYYLLGSSEPHKGSCNGVSPDCMPGPPTPTPTPTVTPAPVECLGAGTSPEGRNCSANGPPSPENPGGTLRVCCGPSAGEGPYVCTDKKYNADCTGCKGKGAPNADNCKADPVVWLGCHCTGLIKRDGSACQACSGRFGVCLSGVCSTRTPTPTFTSTPTKTPSKYVALQTVSPSPAASAISYSLPSTTTSGIMTTAISARYPLSVGSVAPSSNDNSTSGKSKKLGCDQESHRCMVGGLGADCKVDTECGHLECVNSKGKQSKSECVWVEGAGQHKCTPDSPHTCSN